MSKAPLAFLVLAGMAAAGCATDKHIPQPSSAGTCTTAAIVASTGSTGNAGVPVVLNASSTGCTTQPEYAFYSTAPGATPELVQDFSSQSAYTLQTSPSTPVGAYEFEVQVRDATSTAPFDSQASTTVDLLPGLQNDPFTAIGQLGPICTHDGWCWQWPTPTGNDLEHIFSTDTTNVWVTGWHVVLQWNGSTWTPHVPPVPAHVQESQSAWAIGGTSASNMYVLYGPNVDYWNGSQWSLAEAGALDGNPGIDNVWVAPDTGDAYVTLSNSTLEQFHNGVKVNTFTAPCGCGLYAIFGTSSHDIFITSVGGEMHFDGATRWTTIHTGATLSAWQGTANDVWAGGVGQLGHWDGSRFTMMTLPAGLTNQFIYPGAYRATNDIWWYTQSVSGSGHDVFAHWDGSQFITTPVTVADSTGFSPMSHTLIGDRWWFGGQGGSLYTSTDNRTQVPVLPFQHDQTVAGVWGTASRNLYLTRGALVQHWDGATIHTVTTMATLMSQSQTPVLWSNVTSLSGLAGAGVDGADELYATAQVQISANPDARYETVALHYDGRTWTQQVIETNTLANLVGLGQLHVVGPGEAWAFNAAGTSHHYAGGTWTAVATTQMTQPFTSLWAQDASHVWLAGGTLGGAQDRTVVTWDAADPGVFTPVQFPADGCDSQGIDLLGQVFGIGGQPWIPSIDGCEQGATVMWKHAADGTWSETVDQILGDGNSFHQNPRTAAPTPFGGIVEVSGSNVLFSNAGDNGTFRFDGSVWTQEDTGSKYATPIVRAAQSGETFAASGQSGVLVHR